MTIIGWNEHYILGVFLKFGYGSIRLVEFGKRKRGCNANSATEAFLNSHGDAMQIRLRQFS